MNTADVTSRLKALDPEPARELRSQELRVKGEVLHGVLASQDTVPPARSHRRERIIVAIVSASAIVVGVLAVSLLPERQGVVSKLAMGAGSMSAEDLAGWTSTPLPLVGDSSVEKGCAATLDANPVASGNTSVLNSDLRGDVASVILAKGEYTAWCVGTDEVPMFLLLEGPGDTFTGPAADRIVLGPSGARLPPDGYGFAAGTAGDDVVAVTLHEDGLDIVATVQNGWWSAWWPSDDETALLEATFTVETAGGATVTYEADEFRP